MNSWSSEKPAVNPVSPERLEPASFTVEDILAMRDDDLHSALRARLEGWNREDLLDISRNKVYDLYPNWNEVDSDKLIKKLQKLRGFIDNKGAMRAYVGRGLDAFLDDSSKEREDFAFNHFDVVTKSHYLYPAFARLWVLSPDIVRRAVDAAFCYDQTLDCERAMHEFYEAMRALVCDGDPDRMHNECA